jgi:hypothetical protein
LKTHSKKGFWVFSFFFKIKKSNKYMMKSFSEVSEHYLLDREDARIKAQNLAISSIIAVLVVGSILLLILII